MPDYVPDLSALYDGRRSGFDGPDDPRGGPYPEDRITGHPYHYVLNGDHSTCGCGGRHDVGCRTWNTVPYMHNPDACTKLRALCTHGPETGDTRAHTYAEPCNEYHDNLIDHPVRDEPGGGGVAQPGE